MEHYSPAAGGIECEAAASGFAQAFFLFADYVVAFNRPCPFRQVRDDFLMSFVCAEHVFMAGPAFSRT